jgi:hypothetical protein
MFNDSLRFFSHFSRLGHCTVNIRLILMNLLFGPLITRTFVIHFFMDTLLSSTQRLYHFIIYLDHLVNYATVIPTSLIVLFIQLMIADPNPLLQ